MNGELNAMHIRGGFVIDPLSHQVFRADVLIHDSQIVEVKPTIVAGNAIEVDATGLFVCPGFVDIHTHLRDPGLEYKETIETGLAAAARGGFTTICCMPDTTPPLDTGSAVEYVMREARRVQSKGGSRLFPVGCVSRGREGREIAEMVDLALAGCVAFSDDGRAISSSGLLRRAMEYAQLTGCKVIDHCEDESLTLDTSMNEDVVSTRIGLKGQLRSAETTFVNRALDLAAELNLPVHIAHVSAASSVDKIRSAKLAGVPVTAEVTPHHLTLTHDAVAFASNGSPQAEPVEALRFDTNAKVNPPLRTQDDVAACIEGLRDGTIDAIATDHAPHAAYEKDVEFDAAPFGISGLETAFGLCMTLVEAGALDLPTLIERLTAGPVRALGLERFVPGLGSLAEGAPGDVVLLDPDAEWTVEPERFASKGKNTPLAGKTLRGKVVATIAEGRMVWTEERVAGKIKTK